MMKVETSVINEFRGEFEYLSNFYPSILIVNGEPYNTVEHAFQAEKTDDPLLKAQIRQASTPGLAKKLGRSVLLVSDWEQKKLDVMASLVKQKFQDHVDLKLLLLLTGNRDLVEGNTWKDRFWGQTTDGVGENHLGKILMNVRDFLRNSEGSPLQILEKILSDRDLGFMAKYIYNLVEVADLATSADDVSLDFDEVHNLVKLLR